MKQDFCKFTTFIFLFTILGFVSCEKDKDNDPDPGQTEAAKAISFIDDCMHVYYLWNEYVPTLDLKKESDPFEFFDKLVYVDDKWSTLTDDVEGLNDNFSGVGTTFGYSLATGIINLDGEETIIGVVLFSYKDSPAEKAGLQRGDIILGINGNPITKENITDLYYTSSITLNVSFLYDNSMLEVPRTVSLTAERMYLEPVHTYKIIEKGTHKIGYLFYTDFLTQSHDALQNAFTTFKNSNVTDVILDLRYNTGGYVVTAQLLASILAPKSVVDSEAIFNRTVWNKEWMATFEKEGINMDTYFTDIVYYTNSQNKEVSDLLRVNMDLKRLYVITGANSASASESLIIGLAPYLDLITVGERTHGKYCGGIVFTSDMVYEKPDKEIDNWGIYAMVNRFADKYGETNIIDGYKPKYERDDNVFSQIQIGDENEYLLSETIALITGDTPPILASLRADTKSLPKFDQLPGTKIRSNDLNGMLIEQPSRLSRLNN